jgi:outer membrane protein TolC
MKNAAMKTNLLSATFVAAALMTVSAVSHAQPMTRERAVAEALRQNPQIAAARARRAAAEAQVEQADSARWPDITIEVGAGPSQSATLVPGTAVASTRSRYDFAADASAVVGGTINAVLPLYTFGKIDSTRAAAAHGVKAREALVHATEGDIALEVARLYESLLMARETIRLAEELQNYLERTILETEQRLQANVPEISEKDVLRLQSALAIVRLSLNDAQTGQVQARAGLAAYLGLASDAIEPQEDGLFAIPAGQPAAVRMVAEGLARRPEFAALEHGAQAYDALSAVESARYLPDIVVLAWATGAYTPGRDLVTSRYIIDPLNSFVPGVLLGARWQFQGNMPSGRVDERRAQAEEQRDLASWARAGVPAQVKKAHADFERARRDIAQSDEGVARAKKWMVQAGADYVVGLGDSLSVVDAARAYGELRLAAFDAIFRHNVALAELAYATGTIVTDALGLYPGKRTP